MEFNTQSTGDQTRRMDIKVNQQELNKVRSKVVARMARGVKAPGFRKGKVPSKVAEKQLDQVAMQSEILNDAVSYFYTKALLQEGLDALARPEIDIKKFVDGQELEFSAEFEVAPEIKLSDPKKLKSVRAATKATDEDVDRVIENLRTQMSTKETVDRAAKDSDEVWIDFEGFDEKGEPFRGGKGEGYPLALGSGTFIPGFEDNLVGKKAGDEFEFDIEFPKDYQAESLAGKKTKFKVKVNEVKQVKKPELNDAFAKEISGLESVDALKQDIMVNLDHQNSEKDIDKYRNDVIQEYSKESTDGIKPPKVMMKEQTQQMLSDLRRQLDQRGQTMEQHLEELDIKDEDALIKEKIEPIARERILAGLTLSQVAKENDISVADGELDQQIEILKGQNNAAPQLLAHLETDAGRQEVRNQIITTKTIDRLIELKDGAEAKPSKKDEK